MMQLGWKSKENRFREWKKNMVMEKGVEWWCVGGDGEW